MSRAGGSEEIRDQTAPETHTRSTATTTPVDRSSRALRTERLDRLAAVAKEFAGGWLPLSIRYDLAEVMLEAFELWEHNHGDASRYVTEPYESASDAIAEGRETHVPR